LAVRVKIKITREHTGKSKEVIVLISSGAESEEPIVAVDPETAPTLGFTIKDFELVEVELASEKHTT